MIDWLKVIGVIGYGAITGYCVLRVGIGIAYMQAGRGRAWLVYILGYCGMAVIMAGLTLIATGWHGVGAPYVTIAMRLAALCALPLWLFAYISLRREWKDEQQ